jgi:hypothetical protein
MEKQHLLISIIRDLNDDLKKLKKFEKKLREAGDIDFLHLIANSLAQTLTNLEVLYKKFYG